MKTICLNEGELMAVAIVAGCLVVIIVLISNLLIHSKVKAAELKAQYSEAEKRTVRSGNVFTNLFSLLDVIRIANEDGYEITQLEAIQIVARIRKNFTLAIGINYRVIQNEVRAYVLEKQLDR